MGGFMKLTIQLSKKLERQLASLIKESENTENHYVLLALEKFLDDHQKNLEKLLTHEILTPDELDAILKDD